MNAGPAKSSNAPDVAPVLAHLQSHAGLRFDGIRSDYVVEAVRRLAMRSAVNGADYLSQVRRDPAAFEELIDAVTVGETHFMRHPAQLVVLAQRLLPELVAARGRALKIWSAGCATGQEAYTLAMILHDAGLAGASVIGTDLSYNALRVAQAGVYRAWSVRSADAKSRMEADDGLYTVPEAVRRRVEFRQLNLVCDPYPSRCDIIVCRNVLLYLTPSHVRDVGSRLAHSLSPGGWIVTAATDPDMGADDLLRRVPTDAGLMYRRRCADDPDEDNGMLKGPAQEESTVPRRGRHRAEQRRRHVSLPPAAGIAPRPAAVHADAATAVMSIRRLGNAGEIQRAATAAAEAVARFGLDSDLRCLHAELLLSLDRPAEAAAQAAAAVYLDSESAVAHLVLGRAHLARERREAAVPALRRAVDLLSAVPVDSPVADADGAPARQIRGYAETYLRMAMGLQVAR